MKSYILVLYYLHHVFLIASWGVPVFDFVKYEFNTLSSKHETDAEISSFKALFTLLNEIEGSLKSALSSVNDLKEDFKPKASIYWQHFTSCSNKAHMQPTISIEKGEQPAAPTPGQRKI